MSNGFFDSFGLGGLLNTNNISFFDSTDVKTILGRNLVKNFVGKISKPFLVNSENRNLWELPKSPLSKKWKSFFKNGWK